MHRQSVAVAAALMVGGVAMLSGCSGASSAGTTLTGTSITPHPHRHHSTTPTPSATSTGSPTPIPTVTVTATSSPSSSAVPAGAQNLTVTPLVRRQLITSGASTHQLPASDYTGLVPGRTYYAYDQASATYWAGAGLVPSSSSEDAQVSVQDDGSYLMFRRHSTGSWTAYNVGLAGLAGATCPVSPPKAITAIWHWDKGSCRPPS